MTTPVDSAIIIRYEPLAGGCRWEIAVGAPATVVASGWTLEDGDAMTEAVRHLHVAGRWLLGREP
jgi:hypothetical protein